MIEERLPVRRRAAGQHDQWDAPCQAARHQRRQRSRGDATALDFGPACDGEHEQRDRQPGHLRPDAGRECREAAGGNQAGAARRRKSERLNRQRRREARNIAQRPARRHPVQRRGRRDERRRHRPCPGALAIGVNRAEQRHEGEDGKCSAPDPDQAQRLGFRGDRPVGNLANSDVERVAGRVRLMARDVEVAQAQSEINRIEIFERGGKKRQVEREEQRRERRRDAPVPNAKSRVQRLSVVYRVHSTFCITSFSSRQAAAGGLRSGCPCDSPADRGSRSGIQWP